MAKHLQSLAAPKSQYRLTLNAFLAGQISEQQFYIKVSHPPEAGKSNYGALQSAGMEPLVSIPASGADTTGHSLVGKFFSRFLAESYAECLFKRHGTLATVVANPVSISKNINHLKLGTAYILNPPLSGYIRPEAKDFRLVQSILGEVSHETFSEAFKKYSQKAYRSVVSDAKSTAVKSLVSFINDFPATSPLKMDMIGILADVELETSRSQKLLVPYWEDFRNGKFAASESTYWDHCFRFADCYHEYQKDWELAALIYDFIYRSDEAPYYVAPDPKRARALVELAALAREFSIGTYGTLEDISHWIRCFRDEFSPSYSRALATLEVMASENYRRLVAARSNSTQQLHEELLPWMEDFHVRYADCLRERALLYPLEMAIKAPSSSAEDQIAIARKCLALLPSDTEEWTFYGPGYEQISSSIAGARAKAEAEGKLPLVEECKQMKKRLIARTRIRLQSGAPPVTAQSHKMFEMTN